MNVYYDTNDKANGVGLVRLGVLDEDGLSYEYNTLLVVKHEPSRRVFYACDSGCSCPTPFEEYHFNSPDETNMTEIVGGDAYTSLERVVEAFPATREERDGLLSAVRLAVRLAVREQGEGK